RPTSCLYIAHPAPPPPLFPYTTLFRSLKPSQTTSGFSYKSATTSRASLVRPPSLVVSRSRCGRVSTLRSTARRTSSEGGLTSERSEEHTSELQSRGHLVCRRLPDIKKT